MASATSEGLVLPELVTSSSVLGLGSFFAQPTFSDITIVGPDGRRIPCHQVVLAAGSKRLAAVLTSGNLNGEELPVRGVDAEGLEAVLRFLYHGECTLDYKTVIPVYDAAHRLNVPSLVLACESFSGKALGTKTACTLLQAALLFNMHAYGEQCMEVIRAHFPEVVATPDFLTITHPTLTHILADAAVCASQAPTSLFGGALRWALSRPSRARHLPSLVAAVSGAGDLGAGDVVALGVGSAEGEVVKQEGGAGAGESEGGAADIAAPSYASQALQFVVAVMGQGSTLEAACTQLAASPLAHQPDPEPEAAHTVQPAAGVVATSPSLTAAVGGGVDGGGHALDASGGAPAGGGGAGGGGDGGALGGSSPEAAAVQALQAAGGLTSSGGKGEVLSLGTGLVGGSGSTTPLGEGFNANAALSLPMQPVNLSNMNLSSLFMGGVGDGATGSSGAGTANDNLLAQMPPALAEMLRQQQQQEVLQAALSAITGATNGGMGLGGADMQALSMSMGMGMGGDNGMSQPSSSARMGMGGGSRGSYGHKGVCQVDGCGADLAGLREYHMRYKICEYHLKIPQIMRDGVPQRFCQQCGRFHHLDQFDGDKRSCRARLHKHNARRRKRAGEGDWGEVAVDVSAPGRSSRPRLEDPSLMATNNAVAITSALNPLMAMAAAAAAASTDRAANPLMSLSGNQSSMIAAITAMAARLAGGGAGGGDGSGAGLGDLAAGMGGDLVGAVGSDLAAAAAAAAALPSDG